MGAQTIKWNIYEVKGEEEMKMWQLHFELDKYDNLIQIKEFTADEIKSFDGRSKIECLVMIRELWVFKNMHLKNAMI